MGASAEVVGAVEVVLGVVLLGVLGLLGLLVLLVPDPELAPLPAGVELELDGLWLEVPLELGELLFELLGDEPCDELVGWLGELPLQLPASGSTYCWLPADGGHASAVELVVSPSASATRMPMTI